MKKIGIGWLLLLLLLLPQLVLAQDTTGSSGGSFIVLTTPPSGGSVPGGVITCGAAGVACTFNAPDTTGPTLTFESSLAAGGADITKPAYLWDVADNLGASDYHSNWRDNNTTSLMSLTGGGVLNAGGGVTSGGSVTAAAGAALAVSGRFAISSTGTGIGILSNSAGSDLDTLYLGSAVAADIGVVTLSSQNTGTAGFRLLSNTAATAGTDIGVTISTAGDLASGDFALKVQDNGTTDLLTLTGIGGLTVTNLMTATSYRFSVFSSPLATDSCTVGQFTADINYLYLCSASGAWKRAALTGGY